MPLRRLTLLVALVWLVLSNTAAAAAIDSSIDNAPAPVDLVVVMKSQRRLYLYRHGLVVAEYPIALGRSPIGTKHMAGDDKTPIGAYTLDWRNPDSRFYRSLHISYPDATDLAYAASLDVPAGSNIMIHGQPTYDDIPRVGDWTNGCIAVSDAAIRTIWNLVPVGTPIHIYP